MIWLGKIYLSIKIFPSSVTVDLNELKEKIKTVLPEYASVRRINEEPIAYGLVALIAHVTIPEEEAGIMDEVEGKLKSLEEVGQVEALVMGRL